jgi:hypothetical protein
VRFEGLVVAAVTTASTDACAAPQPRP